MPKANKESADGAAPQDVTEEAPTEEASVVLLDNRELLIERQRALIEIMRREIGGFSTRFAVEIALIEELEARMSPALPPTTDVPEDPEQEG